MITRYCVHRQVAADTGGRRVRAQRRCGRHTAACGWWWRSPSGTSKCPPASSGGTCSRSCSNEEWTCGCCSGGCVPLQPPPAASLSPAHANGPPRAPRCWVERVRGRAVLVLVLTPPPGRCAASGAEHGRAVGQQPGAQGARDARRDGAAGVAVARALGLIRRRRAALPSPEGVRGGRWPAGLRGVRGGYAAPEPSVL